MNRCRCAAIITLAALALAAPVRAQSFRGLVVEDSTQRPIDQAVITLVDEEGKEVLPGTRSGINGAFTLHAPRFGTYRVKAVRIGYQPALSGRLEVGRGEVVTVRLLMTVVATKVAAVKVTERRRYSPRELESTVGFGLRKASAVGKFLTAEELKRLGMFSDIARLGLSGGLTLSGNIATETLRFTRSGGFCNPQILLDGQPLIPAGANFASNPELSAEFANERAAIALQQINAIGVDNLFGVEIYRGDTPGPRLTGFLEGNSCGAIIVWTNMQLMRDSTTGVLSGRSKEATTGIQVIRGTVVDADGETPVAGVPVSLSSPTGDRLDSPVVSDQNGEFAIRTKRAGKFRLDIQGTAANRPTLSPVFGIAPEELMIVRLFVSTKRTMSAPMGIEVRALPETYGATDLGGFSYRRERGLVGQFVGPDEIQRRRTETLGSLLGGLDGVVIRGAAPADTILMRDPFVASAQPCTPAYMIDGARVASSVADSTVRSLATSRIIGIEVYRDATETPPIYADAVGACGLIGIWTRD
jgi:hypothetical protein